MTPPDSNFGQPGGGVDYFATTHWSVVLSARADSSKATEALETLCRNYWTPLYTYVRRRGFDVPDAQDLTQQFIAHLLAKDFLANVSPDKGKFRSFLLASLNNFLANEHSRAHAQKRGGGQSHVPLGIHDAEEWLQCEPASPETAETIFERRWALTLLEQAFAGLQSEFLAAGRGRQFERLKVFLEGEVSKGDYEIAAGELAMTANAVGVAVHRLRQRYRERLRAEVANTVAAPAEIDEEMRHLVAVLSR